MCVIMVGNALCNAHVTNKSLAIAKGEGPHACHADRKGQRGCHKGVPREVAADQRAQGEASNWNGT